MNTLRAFGRAGAATAVRKRPPVTAATSLRRAQSAVASVEQRAREAPTPDVVFMGHRLGR